MVTSTTKEGNEYLSGGGLALRLSPSSIAVEKTLVVVEIGDDDIDGVMDRCPVVLRW
jgi:hypothetical protein